jgi:hypothetical protein
MARTVSTLNPAWVTQARNHILTFLNVSQVPQAERHGLRGRQVTDPPCLVMCIAVRSGQCTVTSYLAIHRMSPSLGTQLLAA